MEHIEGGGVMPAEERAAGSGEAARAEAGAVASARGRRGIRAAALSGRGFVFAVGALLVGAVFWYLQFSTASICCGDFDAYYHFRWSRMLWDGMLTGQFPPSFDALPLTTLNPRDYVDHHLLFHVFQIPFTFFPDFTTGAKVGTWLFACAAVLSCFWLVLRYRLSYPLLWLVAILGSSAPFLYRVQMGKAMSVSIVMLVAGIYLLFERKYLWLLPLAFVFALTYDMVFLLGLASVLWLGVVVWGERGLNRETRRAALAVGLVALGIVLGSVINPYFPRNVQLTYEHLLMKVTPKDFSTAVGSEWYPYTTWEFLGNCGVALAAMVFGYVAFRDAWRAQNRRAFFLLLFSTALMVVNMRWRRFSEYWPPFAVLFVAFAAEPLIAAARARYLGRAAAEEAEGPAPDGEGVAPARAPEEVEAARAWEFVIVGTAAVLLAAPMVWYARVTAQDIAGMAGPDQYRRGMEWITKNVPAGEPVFNSDWDDFPKLFFYDPTRPFIAGLDPTYLLDRDRELMRHYERIGRGEEEDPGPIIREKFCVGEGDARRCARYVITDHEHGDMFDHMLDSGWFEVAYEDEDCSVLRLRDQKGDPPPDNLPAGEGGDGPEPAE
jgi:hypothetical protein